MFEAQLTAGHLWKRVIEAIKDLVNEANFDCSPGGMSIQAMDPAHVALVNLLLKGTGFSMYRCERNNILGVNLAALSKVLKTTENSDSITLRHEDDSDMMTVIADSQDGERTTEFHLKLMEIETEALGIPDLEYTATVSMSSSEFAKIVRDLGTFSDTATIQVTRDGVNFATAGDVAEGCVMLKATGKSDTLRAKGTKAKAPAVKAEGAEAPLKSEAKNESDTAVKPEPKDEDDDDVPIAKKFKKEDGDAAPTTKSSSDCGVVITMQEPVILSFAIRYLSTFAKGASLADRVTLRLARDSPCMIEFGLENLGFLRYYLAPKVDDAQQ